KGDVEWARNILGNALILTFIMSAIFITLTMSFLDEILVIFGGSEQTIPYAREFLQWVIPGSLFSNLAFSLSGLMRASGYPVKSMSVIITGVVLNVILAALFIFVFDMGIRGAAIATVISMGISALFAISHFCLPHSYIRFYRRCFKLKFFIIRNIVSIGLAPFLLNVVASSVNALLNVSLITYGGDLAVGAFGIINSYMLFVVMIVLGLCQGMQPIVGYNYGAEKRSRVKQTLALTIKVATIIMISGFVLGELFTTHLVIAFTDNEELTEITERGMRIAFALLPLIGFQIATANFFQFISKAGIAIVLSLSRQLIFLIPSIIVCSHLWGLTGVWVAIPVSDFFATFVTALALWKVRGIFIDKPSLAPEMNS
ncbi:MAG: MATE family efflux transporter, partial [Bacteroidaceae bacterium]|nr:MATE family efflux transporter [Bacteroidaceae bacterium]